MPPLTPSSRRAMVRLPVAVLDLAARDFLEGDREVVLRAGVDHRGRELLEGALAEVVVVRVDLPRALGGHDHAGVIRVHVVKEAVDAGGDHAFQSSFSRTSAALELGAYELLERRDG